MRTVPAGTVGRLYTDRTDDNNNKTYTISTATQLVTWEIESIVFNANTSATAGPRNFYVEILPALTDNRPNIPFFVSPKLVVDAALPAYLLLAHGLPIYSTTWGTFTAAGTGPLPFRYFKPGMRIHYYDALAVSANDDLYLEINGRIFSSYP